MPVRSRLEPPTSSKRIVEKIGWIVRSFMHGAALLPICSPDFGASNSADLFSVQSIRKNG